MIDLQQARRDAAKRYQEIAAVIAEQAGVEKIEYHNSGLRGRAWAESKRIKVPPATTRHRLYIYAHECGHVAMNHRGQKHSYIKEYEAEMYAHEMLRNHGIAVPRKKNVRAKRYVARKLKMGLRRGLLRVNRDVAQWCGVS